MSEIQFSRDIPTGYEINGPVLSFLTDPYVADIQTAGTIAISPATPGGISTISLDADNLSFNDFASGTEYILTPNKDIKIKLTLDGASGGSAAGGKGGNVQGKITLKSGKSYRLVIGSEGSLNGRRGIGGGGDAFDGGYSGGGYTGIFETSVTQANSILIAGGGGGGVMNRGDIFRLGGNGGGLEGEGGGTSGGGTQTSGGPGTYAQGYNGLYDYMNGSALLGGSTINYGYSVNQGGAAGGGYFGGGAGRGDTNFAPGPYGGGGGSGFINSSLVEDGSFGTSLNIGGGKVVLEFLESSVVSSITLVGVATATFPDQIPPNTALNSGSIVYQWYENGFGALSDNINIVGSATTTLQINNIANPQDNGRSFYLEVDYDPSAATPNANNEILRSDSVTLPLPPYISITKQPQSVSVVEDDTATFTVDAQISDETYGGLGYQWNIDGEPLTNGTFTIESDRLTGTILALPLVDINSDGVIDSSELEDISSFDESAGLKRPKTITHIVNTTTTESFIKASQNAAFFDTSTTTSSYLNITPVSDFAFGTGDFSIECWVNFNQTGFRDIFSTGTYGRNQITFRKNQSSQLPGSPGTEQLELYYNTTIIASGGSFELGTWYHVAATRQSGTVRLFINGVVVATGTLTDSIDANDCRIGSTSGNEYRMSGLIQDFVVYKTAKYTSLFTPPERSSLFRTRTYQVSGSDTKTLTITPNIAGYNKISVSVTNANTATSRSDSADLYCIKARANIVIETYDDTSTAQISSINLDSENLLSITSEQYNSDTICLYASEKDIDVDLDLYGAKGSDNNGYSGGEGGYSRIQFTMKKNEEYIIKGIRSNSAIFLYRKGTLIAVVGQGGSAGRSARGGNGGGVNVAGERGDGFRGRGGFGGELIPIGTLGENGTYGSASSIPLNSIYPQDRKETGINGGQTIKCSKGVYWKNQGLSPCQDIGTSKFRLSDGTEVTNSASITRGFKAGYSINRTAGAGDINAGNGGDGATGGDGGGGFGAGSGESGGGGGSGYSDGSITIVDTQIGGSIGRARINVRQTLGDFYIDNAGRILILSNTNNIDPRALTQVTGKVLPGTNTCIDDIRWQAFLDLARDGTKNYRLTATRNESTVKITTPSDFNIYRMLNGNALTLRNSLTGWVDSGYAYRLLALAWDETSGDGMSGFGLDYSILSWSPTSAYGFGYYGDSSNPFFAGSTYNHFSANYWILPPGVPDFP